MQCGSGRGRAGVRVALLYQALLTGDLLDPLPNGVGGGEIERSARHRQDLAAGDRLIIDRGVVIPARPRQGASMCTPWMDGQLLSTACTASSVAQARVGRL